MNLWSPVPVLMDACFRKLNIQMSLVFVTSATLRADTSHGSVKILLLRDWLFFLNKICRVPIRLLKDCWSSPEVSLGNLNLVACCRMDYSSLGLMCKKTFLMIVENALQQPQSNYCVLATDGPGVLQIVTKQSVMSSKGLTKALTRLKSLLCWFCFLLLSKKSQDVAWHRNKPRCGQKICFLLHNPHNDPPSSWEYFAIRKMIALLLRNLPFPCFY